MLNESMQWSEVCSVFSVPCSVFFFQSIGESITTQTSVVEHCTMAGSLAVLIPFFLLRTKLWEAFYNCSLISWQYILGSPRPPRKVLHMWVIM